jgi:hypothetical protein
VLYHRFLSVWSVRSRSKKATADRKLQNEDNGLVQPRMGREEDGLSTDWRRFTPIRRGAERERDLSTTPSSSDSVLPQISEATAWERWRLVGFPILPSQVES